MEGQIEDETLCRAEVDPTMVERPNARYIADDFIDDDDEQSSNHHHLKVDQATMNNNVFFPYTDGFHETNLYLELDDPFNNTGGSSSVDDTSVRVVHIATRVDPYIDHPMRAQAHLATCHLVQHSHQCINAKHISYHCPQVGRCTLIYIQNTSKSLRVACRFSDLEEARANPETRLVNCVEDLHFICDHYMTHQFQEQSRINKAWTMSSCLEKHMVVGLASLFHRRQRISIVECWNPSLDPSQRIYNHSLEMRYARPCWVGDRATQKVSVEIPKPKS
ncbi:NBS-LRR type resistance protein [Cucumis melo var. makuwa]|uniref:NBS-LRR type resistance protein n=1 Tax=Cucumis melo var. makuwa TaxID=1194695 RepID=A0A5A7URT9_CUCMM|nr:NBS-LRR type resistance protein [Cucumis melo var. makuwa]TYK05247.1 NBS-LRR type resistance protein [Cucumis melo var. makuwa]